ncbi:unannotated protein [freshwater metagenome]|uniref:Unannotated protein n=1 Tax=freshwater metagenome TaxID=449393 RepID=A0A6J6YKA5_9ZZZZ
MKRTPRQAIRECLEYRELLINLAKRELSSRYRRSFLGWGWSLLQPIMMTAVYAIMLGTFFKVKPAPGDPSGMTFFAFFLLAGVLPWNLFSSSLTGAMGAVANGGSLITKVWFPRELIPASTILALAFSTCIEFSVLSTAILLVTGHVMLQYIPMLVVVLALQVLFTSGVAFWLAACNVKFKDVEYITSVLLLAYFYLTPVIYSPSFVPDRTVFGTSITMRDLSLANPMARFMMAYRNIFWDIRMPGLNTMLWLVCSSLIVFYVGFRFYVRRSDRFAESM